MLRRPSLRQFLYYPYVEIMRDCRETIKLSQARLAERVGLSTKYVTLIELGKRVPSLESLLGLLSASKAKRKTAEDLVQEVLDSFDWDS